MTTLDTSSVTQSLLHTSGLPLVLSALRISTQYGSDNTMINLLNFYSCTRYSRRYKNDKVRRDSLAIKNTSCFSRVPRFDSQHSCGDFEPSVILVPGALTTSAVIRHTHGI